VTGPAGAQTDASIITQNGRKETGGLTLEWVELAAFGPASVMDALQLKTQRGGAPVISLWALPEQARQAHDVEKLRFSKGLVLE